MEIPGEWGKGEWSQRPKQSKENSGGGGEGGCSKNSFCGGSMDILWNYALSNTIAYNQLTLLC